MKHFMALILLQLKSNLVEVIVNAQRSSDFSYHLQCHIHQCINQQ